MYPPKPNEYYPPPASAMPPPPMGAASQYYPPPASAMPPPQMGAASQYYPGAPNTFAVTQEPQPWSTGLCDCTDDCGNCCMTCFCPCITFGRIAEIVDQGATSCGTSGALYALLEYFTCFHWVYSCCYRSKMRAQLHLAESPCNDCLVHCCCEACALCQEYRELKNRGFDMTIGWHANMSRRAQGMAVPPVIQGGMMR